MKNFKKIFSVALLMFIIISFSCPNTFAASDTVVLGGQPFGIKFYNRGVIVIEMQSFFNGQKYICPAKNSGLKVNDIITQINGETVNTNEALQSKVLCSNGQDLTFTIERNGKEIKKTVSPKKNMAGSYIIGAWIRDSCAGIGTITYYDTNKNYFTALGHGVCDSKTSALLPLGFGQVVGAKISGVTKSVSGKAGSLNGYFTDTSIGILTSNTSNGVYGTTNDIFIPKGKNVEIADKNEIKVGKAQIYTTINGTDPKYYDIEITKICNTQQNSNENFVIKVTSNEIIDECGGIVQGMSGSPIIQNEKLVGAVTHVFLNNPCEGYGVIAQNMALNYNK